MSLAPIVPWWLVLLAAAGGVAACVAAARSAPHRWRWVRRMLLVVVLAVTALRPGTGDADGERLATDLDVYFVVDRTSSIVAEDYDGDRPRLDGVRTDLQLIADGLPGARFAVVGFDNDIADLMPLTDDVGALRTTLLLLTPEFTSYSTGSSPRLPAEALAEHLASERRAEPERQRVVVFVSDGETTADEPGAAEFGGVAELIDGGVVLGYGSADGGPMRERTAPVVAATGRRDGSAPDSSLPAAAEPIPYLLDPETGETAISRIDEDELTAIAAELDVEYVHRSGPGPLTAVIDDLLDAGELRGSGERRSADADRTWVLAYPLLILTTIELVAVGVALARTGSAPRRPGIAR